MELGHPLEIHGNLFVKRSGEVGVGDRIRLQHRPRSIRGQRIPGGGVQNSGGGQVIGLLESSQGASVVVAIHAINFARREMDSIKEHFGFRDQRRIAVVLAARRGGVDRCSNAFRRSSGHPVRGCSWEGSEFGEKKRGDQASHATITSSSRSGS